MEKGNPADSDRTRSLRPSFGGAASQREPSHLLVVEEGSSFVFPLPMAGDVLIGRAPEADLRLQDGSSSRRHARLSVRGDEVRISDLGSRNATRVNGEPIAGARPLVSGDVISICAVNLVFHRGRCPAHDRPLLDLNDLRQRLEEEVDRALRYRRPLTLLCAHLGPGDVDRPMVAAALGGRLRMIDVAAWNGPQKLLLLLPELGAEERDEKAGEILGALTGAAAEVRLGHATCPLDGTDADALLAGAAAAAAASAPGRCTAAGDAAATLQVGDRSIIVVEPAMHRLYALIEKLAKSDLPVLVCGETGTGKEIAASALHCWSARRDRPLVAVNCAALPENLVESELFGHERGAFSGAVAAKVGLLESAHGGSVFLDEIGELPAPAQAKLLRVLETQRLTRVGEVRERAVDIRLVAATHRDLGAEVAAGRFRQDLLFRLGAARVMLPPLRERRRELPVLARALLGEACARAERAPMTLSPGALQLLLGHPWPGNVRELKNVMGLVAAVVGEAVIEPWHLAESLGADGESPLAAAARGSPRRFRPVEDELRELERTRMSEALAACGGVQARAAELIAMPLRTFVTRMKQYHLTRPGGARPRR